MSEPTPDPTSFTLPPSSIPTPRDPTLISYRNPAGEIHHLSIHPIPGSLRLGTTPRHPHPCWLIDAGVSFGDGSGMGYVEAFALRRLVAATGGPVRAGLSGAAWEDDWRPMRRTL